MKILIPVAGETPFFPPDEFPFPKPLVEIDDEPMIARAITNLAGISPDAEFVFVALSDEAAQHSYESIFRLMTDGRSDTVLLKKRTAGALCSCLMAIDQIDMDAPLVIANYDQIIDADLAALVRSFTASSADAGVLTFRATHPRWSYVVTQGDRVVEASEKRVVSRQAIAGFYWFRTGATFVDAAKATIEAGDCVDGRYYVSSSLNQLVLAGREIIALEIGGHDFHSFYLPQRIDTYQQSRRERTTAIEDRPVNVLIPAAGKGSRFAAAKFTAPKPLIDVMGMPMIARVRDNVAVRGSRCTILAQEGDVAELDAIFSADTAVATIGVKSLTEGTACTILLARSLIDTDAPLLVANSDQIVDFKCQSFVDDAMDRNLDGSILVFRDEHRDPKWSFARINDDDFVIEVAEKQPISDLATVGIYFFRKGSDFVSSAIDMIARNDRVNNEFYTCPVYNYMIRNGARIGIYEVPAGSMHGVGTPADLNTYLELIGGPDRRSRHDPSNRANG